MQSFIVGLLLAGVSATTFVAFRHPVGFAKLFPYLLGAATLLFAGITLWHVAVEFTWNIVDEFVVDGLEDSAAAAIRRLQPPYLWATFWYAGLVAFLWANLKLPGFLQGAERDESNDKTNSEMTQGGSD